MKTFMPKEKDIKKDWYLVDADGKVLGKLASRIASILKGKTKVIYTPHIDAGDFVIVVNAEKVKLTGKKTTQKVYIRHTGHPGGFRETTFAQMLAKKPEDIIKKAVWGMIPHNKFGKELISKLKIYKGAAHPHKAQMPKTLEL